jgi:hypothetical protein
VGCQRQHHNDWGFCRSRNTIDADVVITLYRPVAANKGHKVRIANINGGNNVIVRPVANGPFTKWAAGNTTVSNTSDITIAPGKAINLIVTGADAWLDQAAYIQSVSANTIVDDGDSGANIPRTVINVDASGGARTITLPSAASRFGKSYVGPQIFVAKVDSSANVVTIQRGGSDTIDGLTTSKTLSAPGMLSLTATSGTAWVSPADRATTTLTGTSGTLTGGPIFNLTATTAKAFTLPATATATFDVNNIGANNAVITPPSGKKLFTSTGYVDSVTIPTARSAAFSYSANLNAWIKV